MAALICASFLTSTGTVIIFAVYRSRLPFRLLPYLDIQPLDFLIQSGERDAQIFRRFRLAPAASLETLDNHAPFEIIDDFEKRSVHGQRGALAAMQAHA